MSWIIFHRSFRFHVNSIALMNFHALLLCIYVQHRASVSEMSREVRKDKLSEVNILSESITFTFVHNY